MPLPVGMATVTLVGDYTHPDGTAMVGHVRLVPTAGQLVAADTGLTIQGPARADFDNTGHVTITVVATDADGINPSDGTYQLTLSFYDADTVSFPVRLPKATPTVKIAALTPVTADNGNYLVIQGPAGPAGASIRTAPARITDDNLSGLPSAPTWTIAQTSAGTQLKASIAAAAGDRIRVCPTFMYVGAHFLDWALLDSGGAIALYAASGTSSPLAEGNPAMYPSLSFSKMTASEMFTVSASHINSGHVTVALAHQGTSSGTVYAHTTYPWRLRLENIGPEPS